MTYTEVKTKGNRRYYYRVISVREGKKIKKKRIYLGANLAKENLMAKEKMADKELIFLSGILTAEELKILEKIQKEYIKEPKENIESRYEAFCSFFTYNSAAIEGNTLTLQETSQLLFENITPKKSLREINETLNHKEAFDFIIKYNGDITKELICKLHKIIVKNTLRAELEEYVGNYRTVQVYIRGVEWIPPKPEKVPKEMKSLLSWYSKNKNKLPPLVIAAYFHTAFELIHPFIDGNGRVGRLLMNFILYKNRYPMINIPNAIKHRYYKALQEAQIKGNLRPFVALLLKLLKESKIRF